jgi:hypothetical protein
MGEARFAHMTHVEIDLPSGTPWDDRNQFTNGVSQWCRNQFGHNFDGVNGRWFSRGRYGFYFRDRDDAMLFRLTWGGRVREATA